MVGGTLAAFMTACVVGFLLSDEDLERRSQATDDQAGITVHETVHRLADGSVHPTMAADDCASDSVWSPA